MSSVPNFWQSIPGSWFGIRTSSYGTAKSVDLSVRFPTEGRFDTARRCDDDDKCPDLAVSNSDHSDSVVKIELVLEMREGSLGFLMPGNWISV